MFDRAYESFKIDTQVRYCLQNVPVYRIPESALLSPTSSTEGKYRLKSKNRLFKKVIKNSCSTQLSMKFFLLINVKMPTIVGILTFTS